MTTNRSSMSNEVASLRIWQPDAGRRASAEIVRAYLDLPDLAGLVARALDRLGLAGAAPAYLLGPLIPGCRIVGPAVTVRNVPSRIVPLHGWHQGLEPRLGEREAYFVAQPGDVLVVDAGASTLASSLGPNSASLAQSRGLIGAVVDGLVTGPAGIREHGFPVWCRGGTTLTGHHRLETIEINGLVTCGQMQVAPSDLVVADDSGIAIVPADRVLEVLGVAERLANRTRAMATAVSEGSAPDKIRDSYKQVLDPPPADGAAR